MFLDYARGIQATNKYYHKNFPCFYFIIIFLIKNKNNLICCKRNSIHVITFTHKIIILMNVLEKYFKKKLKKQQPNY